VVILSVLINIGTLVKILQMKKSGNLQNKSNAHLEFRLYLIVVWMMCSLIVVILFQVEEINPF
jgi:hypothetical protein